MHALACVPQVVYWVLLLNSTVLLMPVLATFLRMSDCRSIRHTLFKCRDATFYTVNALNAALLTPFLAVSFVSSLTLFSRDSLSKWINRCCRLSDCCRSLPAAASAACAPAETACAAATKVTHACVCVCVCVCVVGASRPHGRAQGTLLLLTAGLTAAFSTHVVKKATSMVFMVDIFAGAVGGEGRGGESGLWVGTFYFPFG
jgi:hypothetical protein